MGTSHGGTELETSETRSRRPRTWGARSSTWAVLGAATLLCTVGCRRAAPPAERIAPRVQTVTVRERSKTHELRLSATIDADRTTALAFSQPGSVEAVLVREGDQVKRGQALARLGSASFRDALGIAQAKAAQAEDAYARLAPMHENKTLPEIKWVEVETGRQQARLAVSLAQKNVDDAILRAPEDGTVARRSVEVGASALPGVPVLTLVHSKTLLAVAPVSETQISSVRVGLPATIHVSAVSQTTAGTVREIGVVADPLTRTYPVKIELEKVGDVRVGMVAEVHVRQEGDGKEVIAPPAAIRIDERGATYVYTVGPDDVAHRKPVTVVGFAGNDTAIMGSLSEGERVVVSGTPMLADGLKVRPSVEVASGDARGDASPSSPAGGAP